MFNSQERKSWPVGILLDQRVECGDVELRHNKTARENRLHLGCENEAAIKS